MKIKKVVLPVAGLGTRFLPASKVIAKEMFPVLDKPLIDYAVDEAISAGGTDFIFVISPDKKSIIKYFEDDPNLVHELIKKGKQELVDIVKPKISGSITTIVQQKQLGLGHAISLAKPFIKDEPFQVLLPDDLIMSDNPVQCQLADVYKKHKCGVVALQQIPQDEIHKYGVVSGKKNNNEIKIDGFVEKPQKQQAPSDLAIVGRYILTPEIFDELDKNIVGSGGEIQITDAMAGILKKQDFYGLKFTGERFDCGSKIGFLEAQIAFANKDKDIKQKLKSILEKYI
ncbi:MAG: UTP--glucose-1-phosphate uridylyltransferase [Alphaproteobacteria bacterium]|nr:UTP--glucose-1-phosphate uridylyltransferase [Alphaproteobacteria bacterium]